MFTSELTAGIVFLPCVAILVYFIKSLAKLLGVLGDDDEQHDVKTVM